jgi:hypothetical protein
MDRDRPEWNEAAWFQTGTLQSPAHPASRIAQHPIPHSAFRTPHFAPESLTK